MTDFDGLKQRAEEEGFARLVVGVVLPRDDRILILQRRSDDFMPGIYELPSGLVEPGETLSAAVSRELQEETGLEASSIVGYIGHFDYVSGSGAPTRQLNFIVQVLEFKELVHPEHAVAAWVGAEMLGRHPISDESRGVMRRYFEGWR
jgi:8-oxo-dGTP diphosphatase